MLIRCATCGRPLCEIDAPSFDENEIGRALRAGSRFGLELLPLGELKALLSPTPESIGKNFNPRCPDGCKR